MLIPLLQLCSLRLLVAAFAAAAMVAFSLEFVKEQKFQQWKGCRLETLR